MKTLRIQCVRKPEADREVAPEKHKQDSILNDSHRVSAHAQTKREILVQRLEVVVRF